LSSFIQESKNHNIFSPLLLFVVKNSNIYESNSEILNIDTRFSSDLYTPTANLTTFQTGPFYFGIKIFNLLPTSIKNTCHDTNQFRYFFLRVSFFQIHFTHWRNILPGIPIDILVQWNQFKSKHLNISTCNTTQYYSILPFILIFNSDVYSYIYT